MRFPTATDWIAVDLNLKRPRDPIRLPMPTHIYFSPSSWGNSNVSAKGFRWIHTLSNFLLEMMKFFPRAEAELYIHGKSNLESERQFGTFNDEGDAGVWNDPIYMADNLGLRDVFGQTHRTMEDNKFWGVKDAMGLGNIEASPAAADFDNIYKVEGQYGVKKNKSWANTRVRGETVWWDTNFNGVSDFDEFDDQQYTNPNPDDEEFLENSPFNNLVINVSRYSDQMHFNQKLDKDKLDLNDPASWLPQLADANGLPLVDPITGQPYKLIDPQGYTAEFFRQARLWLKTETDDNNELGKPVNEMTFYELAMTRKGTFSNDYFKENFFQAILNAVGAGKALTELKDKNGVVFDATEFVNGTNGILAAARGYVLKDPTGQIVSVFDGWKADLLPGSYSTTGLTGEQRELIIEALLEAKKRSFTADADPSEDNTYHYVFEDIIGGDSTKANYLAVLMLESRRRIYSALTELVTPVKALGSDRAVIKRARQYFDRNYDYGPGETEENWRTRESGGTNKTLLPIFFKSQHSFLNRLESFFTPYAKVETITAGNVNWISLNALNERVGLSHKFADTIYESTYAARLDSTISSFMTVTNIINGGGMTKQRKQEALDAINSLYNSTDPAIVAAIAALAAQLSLTPQRMRDMDLLKVETLFTRSNNHPLTPIPYKDIPTNPVTYYLNVQSIKELLDLGGDSDYTTGPFYINADGSLGTSIPELAFLNGARVGVFNQSGQPDPDFSDTLSDGFYIDAKKATLTGVSLYTSGAGFKTGKDINRMGNFTSFMYDRLFNNVSWASIHSGGTKVLVPFAEGSYQFNFTQASNGLPAGTILEEEFRDWYPDPPDWPVTNPPYYQQKLTEYNYPQRIINLRTWVNQRSAKYSLDQSQPPVLTVAGIMTDIEKTQILNIFTFGDGFLPASINRAISNVFTGSFQTNISFKSALFDPIDNTAGAFRFFEEWSYQYNNPLFPIPQSPPADYPYKMLWYNYFYQQQPRMTISGFGWDRIGYSENSYLPGAYYADYSNFVSNLNRNRDYADMGEGHFDYTLQQGANISSYNQFSNNNITFYSPDELNSYWNSVTMGPTKQNLKPPVWYQGNWDGNWDDWVNNFKNLSDYQKGDTGFIGMLASQPGSPGSSAQANFRLVDFDWASNTLATFGKMVNDYIAFLIFVKLFNRRERERYKKEKTKWDDEKDAAYVRYAKAQAKIAQRKAGEERAQAKLSEKVKKSRGELMKRLMGKAVERKTHEKRNYNKKK